jgi:hypothetical protein
VDILKSGRVPIRARCSGHIRADPIEQWLSQNGTIELYLYPASNEIVAHIDVLSVDGRRLALEIDPRLRPFAEFGDYAVPPSLWSSSITFANVTIHWPKLADELQAAGFKIGLETGLRPRRHKKTEPRRSAPDAEIHKAIKEAYDGAEAIGDKPPNLKEIIRPVQDLLQKNRYEASGRRIQALASDPQHDGRRRKPGVTVASEKYQ